MPVIIKPKDMFSTAKEIIGEELHMDKDKVPLQKLILMFRQDLTNINVFDDVRYVGNRGPWISAEIKPIFAIYMLKGDSKTYRIKMEKFNEYLYNPYRIEVYLNNTNKKFDKKHPINMLEIDDGDILHPPYKIFYNPKDKSFLDKLVSI